MTGFTTCTREVFTCLFTRRQFVPVFFQKIPLRPNLTQCLHVLLFDGHWVVHLFFHGRLVAVGGRNVFRWILRWIVVSFLFQMPHHLLQLQLFRLHVGNDPFQPGEQQKVEGHEDIVKDHYVPPQKRPFSKFQPAKLQYPDNF